MKKLSLSIIALFMMISTVSFAQQFNFGIKFGGNSTSFVPDNIDGFGGTSKLKIHVGGMAHYQVYKGFGLQLEALYSGKGDKFTSNYNFTQNNQLIEGKLEIDQNLNYLSFPIFFKYTFGNPKNGFHIDAGYSFNNLIGHKVKSSKLIYADPSDISNTIEEDLDLALSPFSSDNSLIFGLGLMSSGICFDFRMELGRSKIYKDESYQAYHRTFMISAGYFF